MVRSRRAPPALWFSPGQASRCPRLLFLESRHGGPTSPSECHAGTPRRSQLGGCARKSEPIPIPLPLRRHCQKARMKATPLVAGLKIPMPAFDQGRERQREDQPSRALARASAAARAVPAPGAQTTTYTPASHSPTRHRLRLRRCRRHRCGHRTATAVPPPRPWPRPRARCVPESASRRGRFPPCALLLVNFIRSFLIHA